MSKCKTSGTTYTIAIANHTTALVCMANLPHLMDLSPVEIKKLKRRLHDALENVLAETFNFNSYVRYGGNRYMSTRGKEL